jgi:hypothetical protein
MLEHFMVIEYHYGPRGVVEGCVPQPPATHAPSPRPRPRLAHGMAARHALRGRRAAQRGEGSGSEFNEY